MWVCFEDALLCTVAWNGAALMPLFNKFEWRLPVVVQLHVTKRICASLW